LQFWLKHEARIAIFRILAAKDRYSQFLGKWKAVEENWKAVEEIGKPLRKIRKLLRKLEMRQRNWKAIEDDFLGFLGNWKAVE
jgi:hypothetical protein